MLDIPYHTKYSPLPFKKKLFEIIVDSCAVVRNNTDRSCVPSPSFPHGSVCINSILSQPGNGHDPHVLKESLQIASYSQSCGDTTPNDDYTEIRENGFLMIT